MGALAAAILALVALILAPGYSFWFDVTPKTAVLLAGTAAVAVLACFSGARTPETTGRPSRLAFAFGMLTIAAGLSLALSTALSERPAISLFGSTWRQFGALSQMAVLGFAFLAARATAGHPEQVRTILRGAAAATTLVGGYGIAQYLGRDPLLPPNTYHVGEGIWTIVRPPGTLGYVSYFANWLLVATGLALLLAVLEVSPRWRAVGGAAGAIGSAAVLLSGTRAAWIGMAAGAAVWCWVTGWRPARRTAAAALVAIVGVAAFWFSPPGWMLRSRARWFVEDPWGGARLALWRDSVRMALARPAAGFGPEVFTATFPRYESRRLAAAYPDFAHESPHNILLDAMVAQGVPGLAVLAGFCVLGAIAVRRLRKRDVRAAAALGAALAAGFVSQQFTAFTMPTALIWFTALALGIGLCSEAPRRAPRWVAAPALVAACVLVLAAFRLVEADRALAVTRDALASRRWAAAAESFEHYRRLRLPGAAADLWYSRAVLPAIAGEANPVVRLKVLGEGRAAALRATATAEDPFNAWYNAAAYASTQNDAPATERSLREAVRARPNWFKPHWALARLLWLLARPEEAEAEAALSVELDGGKHPEVARTLAEIRGRRTAALHLLQK